MWFPNYEHRGKLLFQPHIRNKITLISKLRPHPILLWPQMIIMSMLSSKVFLHVWCSSSSMRPEAGKYVHLVLVVSRNHTASSWFSTVLTMTRGVRVTKVPSPIKRKRNWCAGKCGHQSQATRSDLKLKRPGNLLYFMSFEADWKDYWRLCEYLVSCYACLGSFLIKMPTNIPLGFSAQSRSRIWET